MTYRDFKLFPELACYLLVAMRKAFQNFAWGQSSFNENILKNIEIPVFGKIKFEQKGVKKRAPQMAQK